MPHQKIHQQRISLVAGTILIVVTLLVGVTVFIVMQRHAEELLSKSLQSSLQNRVQLTETEIRAGFDRTVLISTRPLLIDQLQLVDASADGTADRNKLDMAARSFLQNGLTAIALYGEDGQELFRAGVFAQQPELAVPLNLPGRVQLMWDGQLLLRAVVEIKKEGRVVGKVMTETPLPATTGAFKEANRLGETGELVMCAPFGLKFQCFPTVLNPKIFTAPQRSPDGVRLPMAYALEGAAGFTIAKDYRHQEVVAAYALVGDLGLAMVLKMDSAELYAPVWMQLRYLIPLLVGVLVIALLLLRWLLTPLVVRLVRSEAEAAQRTTALTKEIAERRHAEAEIRKLSSAVEKTADSIFITDASGVIEYVNQAFEQLTGYSRKESLGKTPRIVKSGKHVSEFYRQLWDTILQGKVYRDVFINRKKDGQLYYEEKTITPLSDEQGKITHYISSGKDITERMQTQERLYHLAHHDVLTDMPNRMLFVERLKQALNRAQWRKRVVAVLFIDLDRFKLINDTLGHEAGDRLLQAIAARLLPCVREGDTVARFGGDEFAVLLNDIASHDDIAPIADKFLGALTPLFMIDRHEFFLTASIGLSLYPDDGGDSQTLLKNADSAMYRAKQQGGNTYQFYQTDMNAHSLKRLDLETSLRRALERQEFVLHYQPQFDLNGGSLIGFEALIRWQRPGAGLVPPLEFIPLLEETGLIVPVGEWVLRTACAQHHAWRAAGLPPLRVAVNISGRQFNSGELIKMVRRVIRDTNMEPEFLEFEITEGVLMKNADSAVEVLQAISTMGVRLAIDDFGTGYSSLSYLKRFPIDTLKIDQTFVRDITSDADDAAIVRATITLAHNLDIQVIAEGVETREQMEFLRAQDCDFAQGYYFSRPLPGDEIARLFPQWQQAQSGIEHSESRTPL